IYSMAGEDEFYDDNTPPLPPPPVTPTQQAPHTLSTIKLPILKKGEYDIWAMKMEHYLGHTDYPIWEVIQKGNGLVQVSTDTNGQIRVLPPKTAEEILARERERKARTTLLMSIPEDHLEKFHKMTDAKEMWEAIKSRFEGLHKGYDRFQSLLSQFEIPGAGVSTEDANQKFLRSLPASWSQVSLIIRTKPGVDTLSFDDLYNNLRVFESDIKGSTASSSNTQNVAFVSSESTNNTNDVSTIYGVSTSSGHNSQKKGSSSYSDELKYSFFANQSSGPQLDHEDLEQVDEFDLEEMDLKWQVAMIFMRLKKFYKKTVRRLQFDAKEPVGFDKTKVECFNCHNTGHFPRECRSIGDSVDWTGHAEDEQENFALMTHNNSGSNTEVTSCSKECEESYVKLKKLYDEQREQLGVASIEIQAYTQALKKHLIRDCDFHEKRMVKVELNKQKGKATGQGENRPVWNNVQRLNHQNKFVPKAVLTKKTGLFLVNTARQNLSGQAVTTTPKANFINLKVNIVGDKTVSAVRGYRETAVKASADDPQKALKNKEMCDMDCSCTYWEPSHLVEYQNYNGAVAFGGSKCYITGKGKIRTEKLDFEDVCFVKELQHFNLFSVSQMCDKKNKVLFTDTECLMLSSKIKLPDENQVLLRVPKQNNMYSFHLENIVSTGSLACLISNATVDESNKWHRRLGHVNFKNLNKLVKGNLVRGLPSKIFQNDHTCVPCQKGKQHKASCKAKVVSSISQPLQLLHMDLFGPTSVRSINHKTYCLVITDDFSRFS
ncbi:ribonuclease H-like domain-containing protein, partial [Tanacetum coccineum]